MQQNERSGILRVRGFLCLNRIMPNESRKHIDHKRSPTDSDRSTGRFFAERNSRFWVVQYHCTVNMQMDVQSSDDLEMISADVPKSDPLPYRYVRRFFAKER